MRRVTLETGTKLPGSCRSWIVSLVVSASCLLPFEASGQVYGGNALDPDHVALGPPPSFYWLLSRACPDSRVQTHELDAVRTIEGKLSVAAAMRAAARSDEEIRYGQADRSGRYRFANTPREVAVAVRQNLGPSSVVSRSVDALAFVVDGAEAGTQIPLDQLNLIASLVAEEGKRWGLRNFPVFRFRSRIENDRAGVTLSARW